MIEKMWIEKWKQTRYTKSMKMRIDRIVIELGVTMERVFITVSVRERNIQDDRLA